jgi:hypothetical protein
MAIDAERVELLRRLCGEYRLSHRNKSCDGAFNVLNPFYSVDLGSVLGWPSLTLRRRSRPTALRRRILTVEAAFRARAKSNHRLEPVSNGSLEHDEKHKVCPAAGALERSGHCVKGACPDYQSR